MSNICMFTVCILKGNYSSCRKREEVTMENNAERLKTLSSLASVSETERKRG